MGFEPTTFPVSPGRAQQPFDHAAIFPGFELAFAAHGSAARGIALRVHEFPGTPVLQRFRVVGIVVGEPFADVLRLANIETAGRFTLEDIEEVHR